MSTARCGPLKTKRLPAAAPEAPAVMTLKISAIEPAPVCLLSNLEQATEAGFDPCGFLERAAGIEPATLAWKARALPLCNARGNWAGLDLNQRSAFARQIYSLVPLTTRPPTHDSFNCG